LRGIGVVEGERLFFLSPRREQRLDHENDDQTSNEQRTEIREQHKQPSDQWNGNHGSDPGDIARKLHFSPNGQSHQCKIDHRQQNHPERNREYAEAIPCRRFQPLELPLGHVRARRLVLALRRFGNVANLPACRADILGLMETNGMKARLAKRTGGGIRLGKEGLLAKPAIVPGDLHWTFFVRTVGFLPA